MGFRGAEKCLGFLYWFWVDGLLCAVCCRADKPYRKTRALHFQRRSVVFCIYCVFKVWDQKVLQRQLRETKGTWAHRLALCILGIYLRVYLPFEVCYGWSIAIRLTRCSFESACLCDTQAMIRYFVFQSGFVHSNFFFEGTKKLNVRGVYYITTGSHCSSSLLRSSCAVFATRQSQALLSQRHSVSQCMRMHAAQWNFQLQGSVTCQQTQKQDNHFGGLLTGLGGLASLLHIR